ncbi:MAG: phospholipid carrier-dependent glycosyltransferase [Candidatus Aminicenantaceae bacterium]
MTTGPGDSSQAKVILALIIVLSIATRVAGISFGLPNLYHVDEARFAKISITYFTADLNPHFFHVPSLHTYAVAGLWSVYYIGGEITGKFTSVAHFMEAFEADATLHVVLARLLSVLLGVGTILIVFYLGKKMYSPRVGVLASLFLVFSPVHNKISHYMVPDVPMVFFLMLSFLCIWFIYVKGDTKFYILAGLFAGLATATKYGGQMLFLPLFFAHLFYVLDNKRSIKEIFFSHKLILSVVFFLGGFLAGCPYSVLDFTKFWNDFKWQSQHLFQEGHYGSSTAQPAWLFYLRYGMAENIGKVSQYLVYGGVLLGLVRRKRKDLILIVFPLVLFVLVGSWKSMAARYLLPLTPFLVLIAAFFLDALLAKIASLLERSHPQFPLQVLQSRYLNWAVVALVLMPSVVKVVRFDYLLIQKDTRTLSKEWINSNLPKGSTLALESYGPPLSHDDFSLLRRHTLGNIHLDWLAQRNVEYVIVSDIMYARFTRFPEEFPKQASFYRSLEEQTLLIKTFRPKWDDYLIDLHNPTIKIYRLSPYPNYVFPGNFSQYAQSITFIKSGENGERWTIQSAVASGGLLEGNEKIKNPYVRIVNSKGKEVLKWVVHEGNLESIKITSARNGEDISLSDGDQVFIGYEYDLLAGASELDLRYPLTKEYPLVEKIEGSSLAKRKELRFIFLYTAFPNTRGDDYFQSVTLSKDSAAWTLSSTVFGGELRIGDDYVLNPFVRITDAEGEEVKTMTLFDGRVGSTNAKKRGFAERSIILGTLPEKYRVFVGYDSYYDDQYPGNAGGPELIEIETPPSAENE